MLAIPPGFLASRPRWAMEAITTLCSYTCSTCTEPDGQEFPHRYQAAARSFVTRLLRALGEAMLVGTWSGASSPTNVGEPTPCPFIRSLPQPGKGDRRIVASVLQQSGALLSFSASRRSGRPMPSRLPPGRVPPLARSVCGRSPGRSGYRPGCADPTECPRQCRHRTAARREEGRCPPGVSPPAHPPQASLAGSRWRCRVGRRGSAALGDGVLAGPVPHRAVRGQAPSGTCASSVRSVRPPQDEPHPARQETPTHQPSLPRVHCRLHSLPHQPWLL